MVSLQRYLLPGNIYRPVIQDLFISLHPFYFIILAAKTATKFTNIQFYECGAPLFCKHSISRMHTHIHSISFLLFSGGCILRITLHLCFLYLSLFYSSCPKWFLTLSFSPALPALCWFPPICSYSFFCIISFRTSLTKRYYWIINWTRFFTVQYFMILTVQYLNRTNFRADLISRGQKNRISRGFNFANLVFSKTSRGFNFANSGFLKISRGFNFANSVLKQIFTKHLNIVKILKERRKMIYC